jgi:glutaredoxin
MASRFGIGGLDYAASRRAGLQQLHLKPTVTAKDPQAYVQEALTRERVVIFSQTHCPHSTATKKLLEDAGVPYASVELDWLTNADAVKEELTRVTGAAATTPRVFVAKRFVGDHNALEAAKAAGTLERMLQTPDIAAQQQ